MKNIEDLRAVLFDTLEKVKAGDMDLDRARAISDISQALINTGKLEVDYLKHTGQDAGTGFVPALNEPEGHRARATLTHTGTALRTDTGVVHKMR